MAVLRLSGVELRSFARRIAGIDPLPRHAHLVAFRDATDTPVDQGLLLWFPGPHSYTGEDVLELHTHGGDILPQSVLRACVAAGAQLAGPGDFTRRAFENGKLDLIQAEAVADLIDASSEAAARGALRSLSGAFSAQVSALQASLTSLRVQLEGGIDFPEESLSLAPGSAHREMLNALLDRVDRLLQDGLRGRAQQASRQLVLLGAPNVGKSSLLNALSGEDLAIVSPIAGTTRDAIRAVLTLAGMRIEVIDTAGVRDGAEAVEKLGIERALGAVAKADLVLRLRAFGQVEALEIPVPLHLPQLEVWNKLDHATAAERVALPVGAIAVSALTGEGLSALEQAIAAALGGSEGAEPAFLARARHLEALTQARSHLVQALATQAEELVAEELRLAQRALDTIAGQFLADDLLGEIFSRFCIGK